MAALPPQADGELWTHDEGVIYLADSCEDHDVATEAQAEAAVDKIQAVKESTALQPSDTKPQQNANTGGGGGGKKKKARHSHFPVMEYAANSLIEKQKIDQHPRRVERRKMVRGSPFRCIAKFHASALTPAPL
jgi:hypothetical protein